MKLEVGLHIRAWSNRAVIHFTVKSCSRKPEGTKDIFHLKGPSPNHKANFGYALEVTVACHSLYEGHGPSTRTVWCTTSSPASWKGLSVWDFSTFLSTCWCSFWQMWPWAHDLCSALVSSNWPYLVRGLSRSFVYWKMCTGMMKCACWCPSNGSKWYVQPSNTNPIILVKVLSVCDKYL